MYISTSVQNIFDLYTYSSNIKIYYLLSEEISMKYHARRKHKYTKHTIKMITMADNICILK